MRTVTQARGTLHSKHRQPTHEGGLADKLNRTDLETKPTARKSLPALDLRLAAQRLDHRGKRDPIWGLVCAGLGTIASLAVLLDVPQTYEMPVNILRNWRVLYDPSIREAYIKGQCNRHDDDSAKKACLEAELNRYYDP